MADTIAESELSGDVEVAQLAGDVGAAELSGEVSVPYEVTTYALGVDGELSSESVNPVQNKVVTAALAEKLGKSQSMTEADVYSMFHS